MKIGGIFFAEPASDAGVKEEKCRRQEWSGICGVRPRTVVLCRHKRLLARRTYSSECPPDIPRLGLIASRCLHYRQKD